MGPYADYEQSALLEMNREVGMKKTPFLTLVRSAAMATFLLGGVNPALASPTSLQLYSNLQTYVVSGTGTPSNTGNGTTDYADTSFYLKGAMMISAYVADPGVGKAARSMDALFSFNTATAATGSSTQYVTSPVTGIDIISAFNTAYGAGNWTITSVSATLASNYYVEGVQPNNPDFNVVASGAFTLEVLGSNPGISSATTWNTLQSFLPTTTATPVGTFQWNAEPAGTTNNTGTEPTTTYNLTLNSSLITALKSGEMTILGVAADNQVGYLFNTNNRVAPYLTITADVTPTTPPALTLSTLANNSYTNNATLNVAGTVTDGVGIASLTINGSPVTVNSNGTFSYTVTLITGANTITTIATDLAGNKTTDTRTITLDQTVPVLSITQPADNSVTNTTSLSITGSVTDAVSTVVTVTVNNGQPASAPMNGTNFSATATLVSGLNSIVITATDQAGNVSSIKRSVTCDPTSPSLAVTNPSQDITTTQGSIIISGTVTDAYSSVSISITAGGQTYTPAIAQNGSFSQTISLPTVTTYAIVVTATNQAGTTTTVQRNVIVIPAQSTVPPVLTLSTLANNSFTDNATLNVAGTVTDSAGILSLTINGSPVAVNSDGTFSYAVTLITGPNTITTIATDVNGNQTTDTRTITLDQTAPVLTLSTLASNSFTNNATLNVAGTVTDSAGIASLTINGSAVTVNSNGSFSYAVTLITGANTITTIATDLAGNKTTDTRTITLNQTVPALSITQPADNSATSTASLQITGSVTDAIFTVVTVTVNNGQPATATMNGTNFSATANLISGLNSIVVTATDLAGNVTSINRSVTFDPTSPSLAVTSPSQDITTTLTSITISGTVTDAFSGATISITAGGQTYTPAVALNGGFSQTISLPSLTPPSTDQTNAIIVTATNQAGKTATVQRNIITTATPYPAGDINGDGKVDVTDALLALQIAVGLKNATPDELLEGDVAPLVNGVPAPNGVIDVADAQVILEKAVGLVSW